MFCVFVVLVYLSVLAKRLARKTLLMMFLTSRGDYLHKDQVESMHFLFVCNLCIIMCLCMAENDIFESPVGMM